VSTAIAGTAITSMAIMAITVAKSLFIVSPFLDFGFSFVLFGMIFCGYYRIPALGILLV
jgi:hypothetical protein